MIDLARPRLRRETCDNDGAVVLRFITSVRLASLNNCGRNVEINIVARILFYFILIIL